MEETGKVLRLKYPSPQRFIKDYPSIEKGRLALPSKNPAPEGALISLELHIPGLSGVFILKGVVEKSVDAEAAKQGGGSPGMLVVFAESSSEVRARSMRSAWSPGSSALAGCDVILPPRGESGDTRGAPNR